MKAKLGTSKQLFMGIYDIPEITNRILELETLIWQSRINIQTVREWTY